MNYISTGIVADVLMMLHATKHYDCYSLSRLSRLDYMPRVNFKLSVSFAVQMGWLLVTGDEIELTSEGVKTIESFQNLSITPELWEYILYEYIVRCSPAWASRIPYGRKETFIFMSDDEKRCFKEANLMESEPSERVINWWCVIAGIQRRKHNLSLEDIGRKGERLTLKYELERTRRKPVWESFETNLAGYDILSQKEIGDSCPLMIEVKSSTRSINNASMLITRNEWDCASMNRDNQKYCFYLWLLGQDNKLAKITIDEIEAHLPDDKGFGVWKETEIPFKVFQNKFEVVPS